MLKDVCISHVDAYVLDAELFLSSILFLIVFLLL